MKLYNTPTKVVEDIIQEHDKLTIYTCGPTVYDYPHIGNWFTFLRYDTLVRALKSQDYSITWVMNITDVGHLVSDADDGEDKLEKGAKREGKTAWDVAAFYGDYFVNGLRRLNILQPDVLPKATEHIEEQIELVKKLGANGHTYVIDDGVYFDSSTFPSYADFANLNLEGEEAGARVEFNPKKHNASDFALWKFSPEGEERDMEWDSPWGKGFPGWHLECSAMAMKYLGETIDVHAGGIDHIPVHHTNEIAQSEAATGKQFSKHWMHANHISVNGEKISKSLGNGITLEDIEAKGFDLMAVRLHALESHYRTQSKFTWEGLEAASNRLQSFKALAALRFQDLGLLSAEQEDELISYLSENFASSVHEAISDDLNTPEVLRAVNELETRLTLGVPAALQFSLTQALQLIDDLLGLGLLDVNDITDEQKQCIAERQQARDNKDWAKSDELRDQLAAQGIIVRDTDNGPIWSRQDPQPTL